MQGRPGPGGEPWDKSVSQRMAAMNGTSKQRAIPRRPPGMVRVNQPPPTPRVARPQRQQQKPGSFKRRFTLIGGLFVVCAILACIGGMIATNLYNGLKESGGASVTAANFLSSLSQKDYEQAYKNLGPAITIPLSTEQFVERAQTADRCYGEMTDYKLKDNSTSYQESSKSYSYTFILTRSKLSQPYEMKLTIQQDKDDPAKWRITDYGGNLAPDRPSPVCK
jgi:hypothetical protein